MKGEVISFRDLATYAKGVDVMSDLNVGVQVLNSYESRVSRGTGLLTSASVLPRLVCGYIVITSIMVYHFFARAF